MEAASCTNPTCKSHKGQFEQQKAEFAKMSKYRQDKTLKEQELVTENLNTANNVALTLYDIYSKEALENYLGFWRQPKEEEYDEEVEEEDSDQA